MTHTVEVTCTLRTDN